MTRYSEIAVDPLPKDDRDFVYRNRTGNVWLTVIVYIAALILVIIGFIYRDIIGGNGGYILFATVIMLGVMAYSMINIQKNIDLVTAVEFQNALFSAAFKDGKYFSLIISRDDQMYYADTNFYKLFPRHNKNSAQVLDNIIKCSDSLDVNQQKLQRALTECTQESFNAEIMMDNTSISMRITIVPITRPNGYFYISGREFVVERSDGQGG